VSSSNKVLDRTDVSFDIVPSSPDVEFILQDEKIPLWDIPSLEGFTLQPYVQYLTPKVDKSTIPSPTMRLKKESRNK
jgi:hypothetical protein